MIWVPDGCAGAGGAVVVGIGLGDEHTIFSVRQHRASEEIGRQHTVFSDTRDRVSTPKDQTI
jgi:hypothetical protein